jgi:predicted PurR-regulated permease PerM
MNLRVLPKLVGFGALLVMCWAAELVLVTLLFAILIAFMLEPIATRLERWKVPSTLASFLAVGLLLGAVYGASVLAYHQAREFARNLPQYSGRVQASLRSVRDRTQHLRESVMSGGQHESSGEEAAPKPASGGGAGGTHAAISSLSTIGEVMLTASFVPFLVYFMLSWRRHVERALVQLFPSGERAKARETLARIGTIIRAFIVGNVIVGAIIGAASALAFALLGVPDFFIIGPLSGFLSVVPYLGVLLAVVPPLIAGGGAKALGVVAVVVGLHLLAMNVLYPKLIGERLSVNPLAVAVALLFWGWLWGGFGLLLAVPLTAAMKAVCDNVDGLRGWGALLGDRELAKP